MGSGENVKTGLIFWGKSIHFTISPQILKCQYAICNMEWCITIT